jgi:integrase
MDQPRAPQRGARRRKRDGDARVAKAPARGAPGVGSVVEDTGRTFTREDGSDLTPNIASQTFSALLSECEGVPRIRLHDLRRTHATLALQAGVHVKVVAERLGHSSAKVTLDVYSQAIPAMQEDAATKVAALIAD